MIQNKNSAVVRNSWFVSSRTSVAVCKLVPTCAVAAILSSVATGCATVGPDYKRPVVTPPDAFRGAAAGDVSNASVADARWATLFQHEPLRELITSVLNENYDLKIAAARILQAQAQFGVVRSNQFPTIDAGASAQGQRTSVMSTDREPTTLGVAQHGVSLAWEIDFWGKYRRATESARAQILASEWGRRAVVTSLIGQTANGYFTLRALDLEL